MFGMFRSRNLCSCSKGSANWSWPLTRAHERYHDAIVTTVTCPKHSWSVRLYDSKQMRLVKAAEKRRIVRLVWADFAQSQQAMRHAAIVGL